MVIEKICKMIVKGVTLKSESFFLISPGVLELWRKNFRVVKIGLRSRATVSLFHNVDVTDSRR